MAEVSITQLKRKLKNVNRELVKLEVNSIFKVEEEERWHLMAELEAWNLTKQAFVTEFYTGLLSEFSACYEALDALESFLNYNLDARFKKLALKLAKPNEQIVAQFMKTVNVNKEFDERTDESDGKRRVLQKMVVTSKALLGEIKLESENCGRKNLEQWLKDTEQMSCFPHDWSNLYELRRIAIHTGIELSHLLVHFTLSLAGKEDRFWRLQSKINILTMVSEKSVVAEKFVAVMKLIGDVLSKMKMKGELVLGTVEDEEVLNKMMTQFCEAILDLELIMSSLSVPDTRRLVDGARIRLQDSLGQTLYSIQGLKLRIYKHKNKSCQTLKLKTIIDELWKDMTLWKPWQEKD